MYTIEHWGYERVEEWRLWWTFAYLSASGECQGEVMADAWRFFHRLFIETPDSGNLTLARVTRKLLELARSGLEDSKNAELCLRCYISERIRSACDRLAVQFGEGRFRGRDLWPFVLDDVPSRFQGVSPPTDYQSTADRILETFDPNRGSLNTYIDRLVRRQEDLRQFLLEHNVYLATDWGILNNTTVHKLEDVFGEFYNKTPVEVRQAGQLLRGFHAVYRRHRIQNRIKKIGGGRCQPPTTEQLQQIAQFVRDEGHLTFLSDTNEVRGLLQDMATDLRQYHIYQKTGNLPPASMLDPQFGNDIPDDRTSSNDEEIEEFWMQYRQELLECLEKAIARVIEARVEGFRRRKSKKDPQKGERKAENFLEAMRLNQCEGISMEKIARKLGLKGQYTVSKLLDLKGFRTDVRHQTLLLLRDRIQKLASRYLDPDRLQNLDRLLERVLGERIDEMFGSTDNILTDRVCSYLDRR